MTKILMPMRVGLKHSSNEYKLGDERITGGIERFANHLNEFLDIHPVYITKEDRKNRLTKNILTKAIYDISPDIVITNEVDYSCSGFFQEFNLPLISIIHEARSIDVRMVDLGKKLDNILSKRGHIYFMSPIQLESYESLFNRTHKIDTSKFKGFLNSSYCSDNLGPSDDEILYDACTVGRSEKLKDPFFVHRKLDNGITRTLVMTGNSEDDYGKSNEHWDYPNDTRYNLTHKETMNLLSSSHCFISTCPYESWGITAMEALGCGVPVILTTDKTGNHASERIAASDRHYIKLQKNSPREDYVAAINKFKELSYNERVDISEATKAKNSRENFKKQIERMIDIRLSDKIKKANTLF